MTDGRTDGRTPQLYRPPTLGFGPKNVILFQVVTLAVTMPRYPATKMFTLRMEDLTTPVFAIISARRRYNRSNAWIDLASKSHHILLLSDFFSFTKENQIIFLFDFRPQTFVHTITYSLKPLNIVKMVLKYNWWCRVYNCLDFDIICNIVSKIFDIYKILWSKKVVLIDTAANTENCSCQSPRTDPMSP